MTAARDIARRFGAEAAKATAYLIGSPACGDPAVKPADRERARGALIGAAVGEALGLQVSGMRRKEIERRFGRITGYIDHPQAGGHSLLTLITADSVLADPVEHPDRFARRLAGSRFRFPGGAIHRARRALHGGRPWWSAAGKSAGSAAAARCAAFGLRWAGDPSRAAYEAALSALVTHRHPAAVSAAAATAAGVALAAAGNGPLDDGWLEQVADISAGFTQWEVQGVVLSRRLEELSAGGGIEMFEDAGALAAEAVPAAIWHAVDAGTPEEAVLGAVNAGGETATIAAITGVLVGARYGEKAWPADLTRIGACLDAVGAADRLSRPVAKPVDRTPAKVGAGDEGGEKDGSAPVHVSFLIDRSGSMRGMELDVVGGFNAFIADQRSQPGDCRLTLVQFDSGDPFEVIHEAKPLAEVGDMILDQYRPRGSTPLLDALGDLIESADRRLARLGGSAESPAEDQIVVVFTDGRENASRRWSRARLHAAVEERKQAGWSFVFMGANQDSYLEAGRLGFEAGNIQNYAPDSMGTQTAYRSVSRSVAAYRMSSPEYRRTSSRDFYRGTKEAEEDMRRREAERGRRRRRRS